MPNLSTFISYGKALRKPKGFVLKRFDSPHSEHPYATPGVVDITPTQSLQSDEDDGPLSSGHIPFQKSPPPTSPLPPEEELDERSASPSPQLTPVRPMTPPQKLDVELFSDSMEDWIPSHLLATDQSPGAGSSKHPMQGQVLQQQQRRRQQEQYQEEHEMAMREGSAEDELEDEEPSVYEDEDDYSDSMYSNDSNIVANLQAMNASSFMKTSEPKGTTPKKTVPTPIKIPNPSMHGPKVQVIRSSKGTWNTSSRPESIHSGDEFSASAVSGTTLARALIGNSFVLSSDERAGKYRSGGSVLTRTDSATLPHDFENPFLFSPASYGTPNDLRHSLVPLPANADAVYIPPKNPRRLDDQKKLKRQSTPPSLLRSNVEEPPRPSSAGAVQETHSIPELREAPTPAPVNGNGSSLEYPSSPLLTPNHNSDRPLSNGPLSTASSGKEYDAMLDDYYATAASPETPNSGPAGLVPIAVDGSQFRPPFSPIKEETSSQLSPPTPYLNSRRDSRRVTKNGMNTGSPNGPRGTRAPQAPMRLGLLPIGETQQQNNANADSSPENIQFSVESEPESAISLAPPPVFGLFNRQRSGSAPNPIKIVRDSQDLTSYNLISTRPISSSSSNSPTNSNQEGVGQTDYVNSKQTFPETPKPFSPMWSPVTAGSGGSGRGSMDQIIFSMPGMPPVPPIPQTPMTAGIIGSSNTGEPMPALAQHMLARAASSVTRARAPGHARQASGSTQRAKTVAAGVQQVANIPIPPIPSEPEQEEDEELSKRRKMYPSWVTQKFSNSEDGDSSPSMTGETPTTAGASIMSFPEPPPLPPPVPPLPLRTEIPSNGTSNELAVKQDDLNLNNSSQTSLAVRGLPPLPPSPSIYAASPFLASSNPSFNGSPPVQPPGLPQAASTTSLIAPLHTTAHTNTSQDSLRSQSTVSGLSPHPLGASASAPNSSFTQQQQQYPPGSADSADSSTETDMGSMNSMGSPPPYYTLVFDQSHNQNGPDNRTPTSGNSNVVSPMASPPSSRADSSSRQSVSSLSARRGRSRPAVPMGPRRPSNTTSIGFHSRQRNASVSSVNSNPVANTNTTSHSGGSSGHGHPQPSKLARSSSNTPRSPRFHTPTPKWRGYTMDAAKWTFTSSELQSIVSRAIKQSAEASAIRLLRSETVDREIPLELHRLEMQRTDIKTKYKMMSRRRTDVLNLLTALADGTQTEDSNTSLRILAELKDVCSTLDRLAEDLHSTDEQISQMISLREVHDASALAMAIRKLNASFLKQIAVSDQLRTQVLAMEAERDDAWKQAECVANDYDRLNMKFDSTSPSSSNRSSRVSAMRKSSIRVSKAGLRSTRSSMSSSTNRLSSASFSAGIKSAFSVEDIPPVPPIPRRANRPVDIATDLPSTKSFIALSTDGPTPNTGTRAMYDDLYDMLGLASSDVKSPRRSHSVVEPRAKDDSDSLRSAARSRSSATSTGRPLSMPDRSGLTEVYQNMSADGNAILATLGLLSDV